MQLPPLTIKLLWAAAIALLLPLALPGSLLAQLMMWPLGEQSLGMGADGLPASVGFMPWQFLTHVIVNTGFGSLIFIALTLAFFGVNLEYAWGARRYGLFLLACLVGSGLVGLLLITIGARFGWIPFMPVHGASGVMFGILFAVAYLNPNQQVMLMIPPIPMKMKTLVMVFVALELAFGVFQSGNGLAHLGFLGGMLGAWLHIRYWRGQPPFTKKRPPGPRLVR